MRFKQLGKQWLAVCSLLMISFTANGLQVGDKAPNIVLDGLERDRKISLSAYKGKVIYLDFWASWCGPCRISLPLLNEMRQELKSQGFEVLAINLDEDKADALEFLKEFPVSYPTLADPKGKTPEVFQVRGMPTSYIIDRKGNIVEIHEGFRRSDMDKIRSKIKSLL